MVAVLELLMKIWMKLVRETCAMAQPMNTAQMITQEVLVKNVMSRM